MSAVPMVPAGVSDPLRFPGRDRRVDRTEALAAGRAITVIAGVWLLVAGLVLTATAVHASAAHFAAPVLVVSGQDFDELGVAMVVGLVLSLLILGTMLGVDTLVVRRRRRRQWVEVRFIPNYRRPDLAPPADPRNPYETPLSERIRVHTDAARALSAESLAALAVAFREGTSLIAHLEQDQSGLKLRDSDGQGSNDVADLGVVGDRLAHLAGDDLPVVESTEGRDESSKVDDVVHESSPSVGHSAGSAAGVVGAEALDAPVADVPTVGDSTHGSGVSLPPDLWVGPVQMLGRFLIDADMHLVCDTCDDRLCEVEVDDSLDVLVSIALVHACGSAS